MDMFDWLRMIVRINLTGLAGETWWTTAYEPRGAHRLFLSPAAFIFFDERELLPRVERIYITGGMFKTKCKDGHNHSLCGEDDLPGNKAV